MNERTGSWENELWSYLNNGDGLHCPLYQFCHLRIKGNRCFSRDLEYAKRLHEFLDSDVINISSIITVNGLSSCIGNARIFELVRRLACSFRGNVNLDQTPVSTDLVKRASYNKPIEVRLVPLRAYHGAVWRLKDSWVIHLNSKDTSTRRRFTLYHELFHILAHCKSNPVFKKAPDKEDGFFNEFLADHFSACMLMPEDLMRKKWQEVKDINKMAAIFDVPEPVMYCGLKFMRLM